MRKKTSLLESRLSLTNDEPQKSNKEKKKKKNNISLLNSLSSNNNSLNNNNDLIDYDSSDDFISDDYDKFLETKSEEELEIYKNKAFISKIRNRIIYSFIVFLCVYFIFLIYGALNTSYVYDKKGNVIPEIMSINDIKRSKEYNKVLDVYYQVRDIYSETQLVNYRLTKLGEDKMLLSSEYSKILKKAEKMKVTFSAFEISSEYNAITSMISGWNNGLISYLNYTIEAINTNNTEASDNAGKQIGYAINDADKIKNTMCKLGINIKGIDLTDLNEWTLDKYFEDKYGIIIEESED